MAQATARQFSFRLPFELVERVEHCMEELRESGLDLTRADVVRLLLKHALDGTQCKLELLLGNKTKKTRASKAKPRR
ncbi:MAG: hypothetical protein ACRELY_02140 [Polyangiaceae bacterium]